MNHAQSSRPGGYCASTHRPLDGRPNSSCVTLLNLTPYYSVKKVGQFSRIESFVLFFSQKNVPRICFYRQTKTESLEMGDTEVRVRRKKNTIQGT